MRVLPQHRQAALLPQRHGATPPGPPPEVQRASSHITAPTKVAVTVRHAGSQSHALRGRLDPQG